MKPFLISSHNLLGEKKLMQIWNPITKGSRSQWRLSKESLLTIYFDATVQTCIYNMRFDTTDISVLLSSNFQLLDWTLNIS